MQSLCASIHTLRSQTERPFMPHCYRFLRDHSIRKRYVHCPAGWMDGALLTCWHFCPPSTSSSVSSSPRLVPSISNVISSTTRLDRSHAMSARNVSDSVIYGAHERSGQIDLHCECSHSMPKPVSSVRSVCANTHLQRLREMVKCALFTCKTLTRIWRGANQSQMKSSASLAGGRSTRSNR